MTRRLTGSTVSSRRRPLPEAPSDSPTDPGALTLPLLVICLMFARSYFRFGVVAGWARMVRARRKLYAEVRRQRWLEMPGR